MWVSWAACEELLPVEVLLHGAERQPPGVECGPRVHSVPGDEILAPVVVGRLGIVEACRENGLEIAVDRQVVALDRGRRSGMRKERLGGLLRRSVGHLEVERDDLAAVVLDQVLDLRNVVGRALGDRVVEIVQVVERVLRRRRAA